MGKLINLDIAET